MHENQLTEKKAKWKAFKAQNAEAKRYINRELDKADERTKATIDANIMQGEDFRSQALNNYHKIIELQEVIAFLKGEPAAYKVKYLALLTQMRRETERFRMLKEEHRQEILHLKRVIDSKDRVIA